MRYILLITTAAFTAGLLMMGPSFGGDPDKYSSSRSSIGEPEVQDTDFEPLNRSQVQEMQRILSQKGFYPGDVDGFIGTETREAISNFQRSEGLAITGNPNERTLRALAPPEKHEFFGLAPEFTEETQHPEGRESMEQK